MHRPLELKGMNRKTYAVNQFGVWVGVRLERCYKLNELHEEVQIMAKREMTAQLHACLHVLLKVKVAKHKKQAIRVTL